jgi:hypothetical protein
LKMDNLIKYSELSPEIKKEIEKMYLGEKEKDKDLIIEDVMLRWFTEWFDDWMISRFQDGKNKNRRKYFRFDIEIPVRVIDTLIEHETDIPRDIEYVGTVVNISRGGMFFKSKDSFNISSIIKVRIDLSAIDKHLNSVEALAMVIRSDRTGPGEYNIGVMFSTIYNEGRESLDLFIFKNVAYHIYS